MSTQAKPSRFADRALIAVEALVGIAVVAAIVGKAYGPAPTVVFIMCGGALAYTTYAIVRMAGSLRDRSLDVTGRVEDEWRDALEHEKNLLLQGIKELEADYAIGKVAPEDYNHLRETSEQRAIGIIGTLKRSDDEWLEKAEALVERRVGPEAVHRRTRDSGTTDEATLWKQEDLDAREKREAYAALFDNRPATMNGSPAGLDCNACETRNDDDAVFCVGCGRPREMAA